MILYERIRGKRKLVITGPNVSQPAEIAEYLEYKDIEGRPFWKQVNGLKSADPGDLAYIVASFLLPHYAKGENR